MKKLNIVFMVLLILMIAFAAYFCIGGTLDVQAQVIAAPASEHPDAFASIQSVVASGAAPQQFAALDGSIADYRLVDVTLTLANRGLFDAEWIDISTAGAPGDVAVYSRTGEGSDVPARSIGQVNLKLITAADEGATREIALQYYVHGMLRTVRARV